MPDFSAERSLLLFLLLNAAVFGSAYFFARRIMRSAGSQALLDAALLGYAIQYLAVGIPGLIGCLHPVQVIATAFIQAAALLAVSFKTRWATDHQQSSSRPTLYFAGTVFFVIAFVLAYIHAQAYLPVISNDAMTYHFPAAVQWLQRGRIGLFQTWFFNPANTYSPLAGSIFITWLIIPFGTDVLARFVEVPALLCVGLSTYRLCLLTIPSVESDRIRQDSCGVNTLRNAAAMIAGAAILARPIFLQCMMGKDDLFVAFFFIAALAALSPEASRSRLAAMRLGIAVGLFLAVKFSAFLCAPLLLLAIDGPRWPARKWFSAVCIAMLFAGPWYLRNIVLVGNPLFPIDIPHLLHGIYPASRSSAFNSIKGALTVVVGGAYGLPIALVVVIAYSWIVCGLIEWRATCRAPMLRACVLGPPLGFAFFFWRSPFPEVRFVLVDIILLFVCVFVVILQMSKARALLIMIAGLMLTCSVLTLFDRTLWRTTAVFIAIAFSVAGFGVMILWWADRHRIRWTLIGAICAIAIATTIYINWSAYSRGYISEAAYDAEYPDLNKLWNFVARNTPDDATVAYTNIYLVYPLQGRSLRRQLIYAPTRAGISSIADLGWLGDHLSGEQIIPAAIHATTVSPDRSAWMQNLRKSRANYLVIGRGGATVTPPEARFAAEDEATFQKVYQGPAGWVYQIRHTP